MMILIRFWRSLTKKDSVKTLRVLDIKYRYNICFYFYPSLRTFFSWIRIRIFPDQIRIFGRSGSGLRKKSLIRIREKKPDPKHWKIGSSIKNEF